MSKRSAQRHRQERRKVEQREREGERRLDAMEVRALDAVAEVVERTAEGESSQPRFSEPTSIFSRVYRWALSSMANEPGNNATVRVWDAWYRDIVQQEPFLTGIFNGVVQTDVNRGWSITGGSRQVKTFTDVLKGVDRWIKVGSKYVKGNAGGWRAYSAWQSQSYWATRMGFVSEVGRQGKNGPLFTLWSVDPTRCELTSDPATPLKYYPASSGTQDWAYDKFIRKCSLISTDETKLGYGFPAVARCYQLAKIMVGVLLHYQQKLGTKTPDGILTGKYISEQQWDEAVRARAESLKADPESYLNSIATIMSSGGDMPEFAITLLSNLPDRWDIDLWVKILMRGYETAFGYKGEFTYENAGVLGRGNEVEVMHRNATAMGGKDYILAHQGELQDLLPPTLEFLYDERDVEGEIQETQLELSKAQTISEMTKWVINGQSVLTVPQIMTLAAEQDIIPAEWTPQPEDTTATDEEGVDEEAPVELSERVWRAVRTFPDEPIMRYSWPSEKKRILRNVRRSMFYIPKALAHQDRTVGQVVKEYKDALTNWVYETMNGRMDAVDLRRAHKALIRKNSQPAYFEGMREGGIGAPEDDATEKDYAAIKEWVTAQAGYTGDFASAVVEARGDDAKRAEILRRVGLWADSVSCLGQAGLLSAKSDRPAVWHLGKTETHCNTCVGLDGKRHRVSWFLQRGYLPHTPGNAILECEGYGHCYITDATTGERISV
jgi:hypothetical protein